MGNSICSKFCDVKTKDIINISDQCIDRLTEDDQIKNPKKISDDEWMIALKCLDDIHSQKNGLTTQNIDILIAAIEEGIGALRPQLCATENLLECLKRNNNCMIKCKRFIDEFIDCVDKTRIDIIKEKAAEEERNRLKELAEGGNEGNELAKQYLKTK